MTNISIKSENQSGGVTAQNVNSNVDQFNRTSSALPESRSKKVFWWVVGIAGIVSAIMGTIAVFKK